MTLTIFIYCVCFCILIELILILGSMTDSVCTAYESRKQRNDSLSTLKGIVFKTKYNIYNI